MLKLPDQDSFVDLIKIRIGEPITAIDINFDLIGFGAISGYFGCYNLINKEVKYVPEVFDEIVRGVYIKSNKIALIAIGDT
jgi:hypothetical protein